MPFVFRLEANRAIPIRIHWISISGRFWLKPFDKVVEKYGEAMLWRDLVTSMRDRDSFSRTASYWGSEVTARLVHSSILVDRLLERTHRVISRTRKVVILGFLSDRTIERLGMLGYGGTGWYRPGEDSSWPDLFDWEKSFIDKYVPPQPARVLIGGAGAGRESFHFARAGYDVVAFEPIPFFVDVMRRDLPRDCLVHAYRGKYEELPFLIPSTSEEQVVDLTTLPTFDAAVLGWCSISHVLDDADRLRALKVFANVVNGPILISFFTRNPSGDISRSRLNRWRRRLPGRNQDPAFDFRPSTGVFRTFTEEEILELCMSAGLIVQETCVHKYYSPKSYVVVRSGIGSPPPSKS